MVKDQPLSRMNSADAALYIIIPVYNEEASIKKVILEWVTELDGWMDEFRILVVDDGSTDKTPAILKSLSERFPRQVEVLTKANAGHGQACLTGYREAAARGAEFVLQIDSDGQCDPQYFHRLWRMRERFDVIYGVRKRRDDGWRRVFASFVLKIFLLVLFQKHCRDSNVPYRLMRVERARPAWEKIGPEFNLVNIALSLILEADPKVRAGYVPIRFRERYGGEPKVKVGQFYKRALELRGQLAHLLR
jgi:dolichol-phosphate mannosyltransferase